MPQPKDHATRAAIAAFAAAYREREGHDPSVMDVATALGRKYESVYTMLRETNRTLKGFRVGRNPDAEPTRAYVDKLRQAQQLAHAAKANAR